ncbi:MAG: TRAP transporter substrate-binding protein DctP [Pseudomonadota bacterium]
MSTRFFVRTLLVLVFMAALGAESAQALVLKIGTLSPSGSSWMKKMEQGADEVFKKTEGRVQFKYYPGGVMGDDQTMLRKMRIGQLHGGAIMTGALAGFYSDVQVFSLPLIFNNFNEVAYVRERMDQLLVDGLEKGGIISFGMADGGFAFLMSKAPIRSVSDLTKQKVWIPDQDNLALKAAQAIGVTPIPLSMADVRTGLQTGLIDTVGVSPIGAVALQWHTQLKYLTEVPIIYIYATFMITEEAYRKIDPADRPVVREIMGRWFKEIDKENMESNSRALEALKNQGIQFIRPEGDVLAEWRRMGATTTEDLIKSGRFHRDIIERLLNTIDEYRKAHPDAGK